MIRSLLRIALIVFLILAAFAWAVRQPVWSSKKAPPGRLRADPVRLERHVRFLAETVAPRDVRHPENLERAARYLAEAFTAAGARVELQPVPLESWTSVNVVARFGPETGRPWIVGAHYDAFGDFGGNPGADDNASGTAGLLELARLFGSRRPVALGEPVELVAYTAEEPPYFASPAMGSAVHARSLAARGVRPQGMICLEMIGYFSDRQPWPSPVLGWLYPDTGDFIAVVGRWRDRALARSVKRAMAGVAGSGLPVYSYNGLDPGGLDASDHRSYWEQGVTAVMVTDTAFLRNPNYHNPDDRPETLDYRRMARVVDGVANALP